MTDGVVPPAPEDAVAGTTTITARALQRLAVGIVHDAARVSTGDVGVQLSDRRGAVRIAVTVPVTPGQARNVIDSGEELRRDLIEKMRMLAAREVSTVDIQYSGVRRSTEKRVR
ncbi:hypothetical protein [Microbacterium paraoxydans]|uniref:hypothetical protein n=1 Tax=Microbacterium paraoxydans TaxID=199592 RepID=UPI001CFBB5EE|nr:hypothetical protein [Microbacterium paraoxydans]